MYGGGQFIRFPIDTDHIEYWSQFWEPVILTVWDAKSNTTYWESIQKFLEGKDISGYEKKTICVDIPTDNILDEAGIKLLEQHTRSRHARFEQEQDAAALIAEFVKNELGIVIINHAPKSEITILRPEGGTDIIVFGDNPLIAQAEKAETMGLDFNQLVNELLAEANEKYQEYLNTGEINIFDENGTVTKTYGTFEDWLHKSENKEKRKIARYR